jgi:hypothetical protein
MSLGAIQVYAQRLIRQLRSDALPTPSVLRTVLVRIGALTLKGLELIDVHGLQAPLAVTVSRNGQSIDTVLKGLGISDKHQR